MAEDLRLTRTYDALTEAFRQLIQQKDFEQITVKELCTVAKTRTATFYTHFSDKYDFFAFMINRMRDQFIKEENHTDTSDPQAYFTSLIRVGFDFIEKNESMLHSIDADSMLAVIAHTTSSGYRSEVTQHFIELREAGTGLPADPELMTEMFIGAMSQTSRWWFEHRAEVSKEEMIQRLSAAFKKMIQPGIHR